MKLTKFILILVAFWGGVAHAKRNSRDGLNFGTTLRLTNVDDQSYQTVDDPGSHRSSKTQAVTPYLGYVIGESINLGLSGHYESSHSEERRRLSDREEIRVSDKTISGVSLFLRYLFGGYFYFETGIGAYSAKANQSEETITDAGDGTFAGKKQAANVRGLGGGYHGGIGMELPLANGFFMTSNYTVRVYQLRAVKGESSIGGKIGREERQELAFGLSHYVD